MSRQLDAPTCSQVHHVEARLESEPAGPQAHYVLALRCNIGAGGGNAFSSYSSRMSFNVTAATYKRTTGSDRGRKVRMRRFIRALSSAHVCA